MKSVEAQVSQEEEKKEVQGLHTPHVRGCPSPGGAVLQPSPLPRSLASHSLSHAGLLQGP